MNQTAVTRELVRLGLGLFALLIVYSILRTTGLYQLTGHETEGLNTLILLVGSIYAVILAFAIFAPLREIFFAQPSEGAVVNDSVPPENVI